MSAVIAGKSCKVCHNEYFISLGHPKWFDDVTKRKLPPSKTYIAFREAQSSGLCPPCWLSRIIENLEDKKIKKEDLPEEFIAILFQTLNLI